MTRLIFELPVPPSPNTKPRSHWGEIHKWVKAAKRDAWFAALEQHVPIHDVPVKVRIHAIFVLEKFRDQDNLVASLKPVLDALKLPRTQQAWREGIAELKGYFFDDDPEHMTLTVNQVSAKGKQYLALVIVDEESYQAEQLEINEEITLLFPEHSET
jgi:hypothetical protein